MRTNGHFDDFCKYEINSKLFALEFVIVVFFKTVEKIEGGDLILYLEKFGMILYFNFLQKLFM